jgi:hypothetical protein
MSKLSCSFTLGKASSGNANIEHNNREFISSNVDVSRLADNIVYVRQDVRAVYDELFGQALEQYNAKQKRNDRKIHDYYEHISQGGREEAYYEIIVQFGDASTAGVGTLDGKFATEILDEYMQSFQKRNPNLRVFNATLHADETTPHIHINFVPFYTEQKKIGMSQGVSMKSALIEQGFAPQGMKLNQLVMWENSELEVMEDILNGRGIERNVVGATHAHKSVPQYKESQDWRKLPRRKKNMSTWEVLENDLRVTREKNSLLQVENDKLLNEKHSEWKCFYFSDHDKHIFVQNRLAELGIPFRENEQGFESQQCHVERIRQIEKQYKAEPTSHRDVLRRRLDKIVMMVESYDKVFDVLENHFGYEIKHGKYTSVRPQNGDRFIRIKSLGEMYNEQALRNRVDNRNIYEEQVTNDVKSLLAQGEKETLKGRGAYAVYQYVITFKGGQLPARKRNPKQPFTFVNDAELDRLAALNKRINEGATIASLQNELADSERAIVQMGNRIEQLRNNAIPDKNLFKVAERWYDSPPYKRNRDDVEILERYEYTSDKYYSQKRAIADNETVIVDVEKSISAERNKIKTTTETLTAFEELISMTYVQKLLNAEKDRRQSKVIGNGVKSADSSMADSMKIDRIAAKVAEVVEPIYKSPKRK